MARQLRIEYAGAVYHVMARGDQGAAIFADDQDREKFLATLAQACEKTGWLVHAYVLMGNHYHVLLETPEANLVAGMKWLQGTYTHRYNRRHQLSGHLFQGRYRAVVMDAEDPAYFGVVSTYVHLNPARAGLVRPGEQPLRSYRWSSFSAYLKDPVDLPSWLRTSRVLAAIVRGPDNADSRRGYEAYMESRVLELGSAVARQELEAQWHEIRRGWYLGGERFQERLLEQAGRTLGAHQRASYEGGANNAHDARQAENLLAEGLTALGMEPNTLNQLPKGAPEKLALAWWLRRQTIVARKWIGQRLVMGDLSRVTQGISLTEDATEGKLLELKLKLTSVQKVGDDARQGDAKLFPEFLD